MDDGDFRRILEVFLAEDSIEDVSMVWNYF